MDTRLTSARVKPCMGLKSDGHQINTVSHWLYFGLILDGQRTNTRQTLYRNLLNTVCIYNKVIPNRHQVFTRRRPDEYVTDTGRIQETQEGQSMDKNWFDTGNQTVYCMIEDGPRTEKQWLQKRKVEICLPANF